MLNTLTQRLISMQPPALPYHLERFEPESFDDGLTWLRFWHDEHGVCVWQPHGDQKRRHALRHWLFLRWLYRSEWQTRGGVDVG